MLDLAETKRICEAATSGPWYRDAEMQRDDFGSYYLYIGSREQGEQYEDSIAEFWHGNHDAEANAVFTVHARTALLAAISLLERIKELAEQRGWVEVVNLFDAPRTSHSS